MKIVQVNTVWDRCSTGRIAAALHSMSMDAGFDSRAAYGRGPQPEDLGIKGIRIGNPTDFCLQVLHNFTTGRCGFGLKTQTRRFLQWLEAERPDILHLHNLHGFYLHAGLLFDYIRQNDIPVVWTLHDCWPFTGHCAFFDEKRCGKWETGCHDCPVHCSAYPYALLRDASRENWLAKKAAFSGVRRMRLVAPSAWIAGLARRSFLKCYPMDVFHNGIDLSNFRPMDGNESCPNGNQRKDILAVASIWESRKGLSFLLDAADVLRDEYRFTIVGLSSAQRRATLRRNPNIRVLDRLENPSELARLYSNSRIFANPTLLDNFPTTNLEALACGTPVVTFASGGSAECLTESCGIAVPPGDTHAFVEAIRNTDARIGAKLITKESCRKQAENFDKGTCFRPYLDLYSLMLSENHP